MYKEAIKGRWREELLGLQWCHRRATRRSAIIKTTATITNENVKLFMILTGDFTPQLRPATQGNHYKQLNNPILFRHFKHKEIRFHLTLKGKVYGRTQISNMSTKLDSVTRSCFLIKLILLCERYQGSIAWQGACRSRRNVVFLPFYELFTG